MMKKLIMTSIIVLCLVLVSNASANYFMQTTCEHCQSTIMVQVVTSGSYPYYHQAWGYNHTCGHVYTNAQNQALCTFCSDYFCICYTSTICRSTWNGNTKTGMRQDVSMYSSGCHFNYSQTTYY